MIKNKNLVLYISMSLDGYIATSNDAIDFLSIVEQKGEDYGYKKFISTIDTVIIGRKTFDKVKELGFEYPHIDKEVYILTRTAKPSIGNFKFYTDDLHELVDRLKKQPGKNIYCDGGAEIANTLMKHNLVDEFVISVIPILLGDGIKLFNKGRPQLKLQLLSIKQFSKGLVQMHYKSL